MLWRQVRNTELTATPNHLKLVLDPAVLQLLDLFFIGSSLIISSMFNNFSFFLKLIHWTVEFLLWRTHESRFYSSSSENTVTMYFLSLTDNSLLIQNVFYIKSS